MIELQEQQDLGRVKNAIQDYLIHKLLLPKIYLDAQWSGSGVAVLAIDRAGVGDVHAVSVVLVKFEDGPADWQAHVTKAAILVNLCADELLSLPAHFRYLALFNESSDLRRFQPSDALVQKLIATDGVGRIGILVVDFADEEPSVRVILKPERFRSSKELVELADSFVVSNQANWEVRE
jgi:hypothetical protein